MQDLQLETLYDRIPKQIIACFFTTLEHYSVEHMQMHIPTDFNADSLNQLLCSRLQAEQGETDRLTEQQLRQVRFEFMIEGRLLRGELKSHLVRYDISCEKTIEIEYVLGFEVLALDKQALEDDWVSGVCEIEGVNGNGVVAGLFSGQIGFYGVDNVREQTSSIDDGALKTLKLLGSSRDDIYLLITGGISERLRVSTFRSVSGLECQLISDNEHQGSILAADTNPSLDGHLCTVGSTGSLYIWKVPERFEDIGNGFNVFKANRKRRERSLNVLPLVAADNVHKSSIEAVCWLSTDRIITGSSDHYMKLVDVERVQQVRKMLTKHSITTHLATSNGRILSSHEDGYLRLWDERDCASPANTFKSHSKYAACAKFHPSNHNVFASASYDGTIKVWDSRSIFPLQNIAASQEKVFTLTWKNERELVSGGSDSKINFYHL